MATDRDAEAAEWLSRLRTRSVGNAELASFASWRRLPGNAEAYRRAEQLWDASASLGSDREVADAVATALRTRRGWWASPMVRIGAMGSVVAALLVVGFLLTHVRGREDRYRTAIGERSSVELADGSRMRIDADSDVRVGIGTSLRQVDLDRGQAVFAVRHDAARPFVVSTPSGVTVTALGTRFDVEVSASGDVGVALLEGRVAVRLRDRLLAELTAGQTMSVTSLGRTRVSSGGADDRVGWTDGRLVLRDETLRDAVERMNRYSDVPIAISSEASSSERLSGEFSTDDPDAFVRAVDALLGPGVVRRGRRG